MSKQWPDKPKRRSPMDSGNNHKGCCPMVAAVKSVKRGKFRLARRYAALSVRLIARRGGWAIDWLGTFREVLLFLAVTERPTF
jgi:hypothetical protein